MKPNKITVHCSETPNGKRYDIKKIEAWHLKQGWDSCGYHLIIQPSGEVQRGRPLNVQGAHVFGANRGNIGICLIGTDRFTEEQFKKLRYEIESIITVYDLDPWNVFCHREFTSARKQGKTCPNIPVRNLLWWWATDDWRTLKPYLLTQLV